MGDKGPATQTPPTTQAPPTTQTPPTTQAPPATQALFDAGLPIRRAVLGAEYVDASIAKANDFTMAMQHLATEMCWGYVWAREGLDRRTRSLLNLAMLTALKAPAELKLHVRGALNNGVSVEEIREAILHATVYCGVPAGLEAFKAANEVLVAEGRVAPSDASARAAP